MVDLFIEFVGIKLFNFFWLVFVLFIDKVYNVVCVYQVGWGGVVWKIFGEDFVVVNVLLCYFVYFGLNCQVQGINNIELIIDCLLEINLCEIVQVKKDWLDCVLIVLLMVFCVEELWKYILLLVEVIGVDGIELNFGCFYGMFECGMGVVVGQVLEYVEMVICWCKIYCLLLVIVKFIFNIIDICQLVCVVYCGGVDVVLLINIINLIISVDLECMVVLFVVGIQSIYGGYCGLVVKLIVLNMVVEIVCDLQICGLLICGIGGIGSWCDVVEFVVFGCGVVQVCMVVMLYGFCIVEDMQDGFVCWMDSYGYQWLFDFSGGVVGNIIDWKYLDINYQVIVCIDQDVCIGCGCCYIVCEDILYQVIVSLFWVDGMYCYEVIDVECVGCNLCQIICLVENCIEMVLQDIGKFYFNWIQDLCNFYCEVF